MTEEFLADKILRWLGENPEAYYLEDKWPGVIAALSFYSLPIIFGLLVIFPFFLLWYKKKEFTLRNISKAFLLSVGLVIAGIIALFFLFSFMLGQIAQEIN